MVEFLDKTGLRYLWGKIKATFYQKPSGGIPKSDLSSAVQTSLGKADTALQSHQDISGKVDKVTSTDNAVVRFNGTSGAIQNSGVTIDDSNNVTAAKFKTSGGTNSQFVKGDGSLDNKSYIPYGAALLNINPFATDNLFYTSKTDSVLYSASERYVVTHKYYDSNDNFLGDLRAGIFDGNYEKAESRVKDNTYAVLYIGKVAEENLSSTTSKLWTYGSGYIFLSFYANMPPLSITAKAYFRAHSSIGQEEKWYDKPVTQISPNVWRIDCTTNAVTYPVAYKITYTGKTIGSYGASLAQVEMYKTRSAISEQSAVTKYPIIQDLWGDIVAPKFIKRGGTSSQFLKADGSVDSNTYLTQTTFNSGNPDLKAIEALSGTTGLLKKTAANTWTLDTSAYLTSSDLPSAITDTEMDSVLTEVEEEEDEVVSE